MFEDQGSGQLSRFLSGWAPRKQETERAGNRKTHSIEVMPEKTPESRASMPF